MTAHLQSLFSVRELLWAWTARTIRGRYQQSVLGGLWAILQPASSVIVFSVIFTRFIPVDTGGIPYVIFSYCAMLPWTLFASGIQDMVASLVSNMELVTKIYFNREVLPLAALLARLLDYVIGLSLLIILMVIYRMPMFTPYWLLIPLVLLVQLALMAGVGFIGAALNVFYRDIKHLFVMVLQLWFYATPIIYPTSTVPEQFRYLYFLNPMAGIMEAYRNLFLRGAPPEANIWISVCSAAGVLVVGYWFFKRVEYRFADQV